MIINNISTYLKHKGYTISMAEKKISLANGTLSKAIKDNNTIKTDTLEKFLLAFDDINPEWLLTGKGEMLKSNIFSEPQAGYATTSTINNSEAIITALQAELKVALATIAELKAEAKELIKEIGKKELLLEQMEHNCLKIKKSIPQNH